MAFFYPDCLSGIKFFAPSIRAIIYTSKVRLCLNRHEWFSRSERKATSFQLDSFWVEPVGYGLPTGSGLLFERLLPELHRPSRERESGNGGVARPSRALAARESRVPPAGRILEESLSRCPAPHRRTRAKNRTTRR